MPCTWRGRRSAACEPEVSVIVGIIGLLSTITDMKRDEALDGASPSRRSPVIGEKLGCGWLDDAVLGLPLGWKLLASPILAFY